MEEGHTYVFSRSQRLDAGAGTGRTAGSCVHGDSHQASSFGKRGCPQHSTGLLNTGAKCTYYVCLAPVGKVLSFGKKDEKQFSKTAMFKGGRTWGKKQQSVVLTRG